MSEIKIDIGTKYSKNGTKYSKKFEEQVAKLDDSELKTFYDELFEQAKTSKSHQDILDALEKMKYINKYLDSRLSEEKKYYCKKKMTKSIIDD
ncbi:MAG: hypothetical protein KAJ56_03190 [Candidatus Aenigmarchaeota archaeon]|nr:hypothetical protein [Candidatus Aenigmarchaeota archaeon]